MPVDKGYQGYNHMIAGGVAGSCAVLLLHPFDVIKTRLQGEAAVQHAVAA